VAPALQQHAHVLSVDTDRGSLAACWARAPWTIGREAPDGAAQAPDWDDDWWQAEQQMQNALLEQALTQIDEHDLEVALTHVSTRAGEVAHEHAAKMAQRQGVSDPALLKVAAGAAAQAAYQAALVLAARSADDEDESEDEHPFAIKFRLFEAGRLPLGITGSTFNLF